MCTCCVENAMRFPEKVCRFNVKGWEAVHPILLPLTFSLFNPPLQRCSQRPRGRWLASTWQRSFRIALVHDT